MSHQRLIGPAGGYRRLLSFGFTCLAYHATTRFCRRVYPWKEDPLGKTSGQMIGAARSARQNIAEGSARAGTSKETEIRLLDVAKGSLEELAGDYETYLVDNDEPVWSHGDPRHLSVMALQLDEFAAAEDIPHAFSVHLIAMRKRFAPWLEHENPQVAANAILVVVQRAESLLFKQIEKLGGVFLEEGGFKERMTRLRLEQREASAAKVAEPPPSCPACGKPMTLRKAKSGPKAGKSFWGCSGYPACKAIQEIEEK
jgi:four helix bundle suffix protein